MNKRFLVPDTGLLLAIGFGADADPKAPIALNALSRALAAGARVVAPPSISEELDRKLSQLDTIFELLQAAANELPQRGDAPAGLEAAEKVLMTLQPKHGGPRTRFLAAIEEEVSRTIARSPSAPLRVAFGYVAANALLWKEGVKLGSRPNSVTFLPLPKANYQPMNPPIPEVNGPDLAHIRACQEIGEQNDGVVVFLILERVVYQHKVEIELAFPRVKIAKPAFLDAYLK